MSGSSASIRLLVEYPAKGHEDGRGPQNSLTGADGVVIHAGHYPEPGSLDAENCVAALLCNEATPYADWRGIDGVNWVCPLGLERTARLRDDWPEQPWLPRLTVCKPSPAYRFSNEFDGEGFKFYRPDTAAIGGYRVAEGDLSLWTALEQAKELDFETVWLHAADAESRAAGLDLEMLERARRDWRGGIWISGGAAGVRHLENLARQGGAAAVVVPAALALRHGCRALSAALAPSPTPPTAEAPLRFAGSGGVDGTPS